MPKREVCANACRAWRACRGMRIVKEKGSAVLVGPGWDDGFGDGHDQLAPPRTRLMPAYQDDVEVIVQLEIILTVLAASVVHFVVPRIVGFLFHFAAFATPV